MFGRATITLGIGPYFYFMYSVLIFYLISIKSDLHFISFCSVFNEKIVIMTLNILHVLIYERLVPASV